MSNIIIDKPDSFGKTRSEHEENLRKEWGATMSDEQLDKLKYMESCEKNINGSNKNFITGIDIDRFNTSLSHCDHSTGRIFVGGGSKSYGEKFDNIFRKEKEKQNGN